ncbi:MAG: cupin domain-containing protein [Halobacteriota archaeon]|uniref:cupin domain-containing protein n=1 Tax=Natronomonas sp. TaxID=2184060 RepID=UPI0039751250
MTAEYAIAKPDDTETEPSEISGTPNVNLADILGCTEMRPRVWYLDPGDGMSYHRQDEQEEFYYVLEGPGRIRLGEEILTVEEGTALCVPPETPRQVFNDSDDGRHVWLVVGAPALTDDGRPIAE